MSTTLASRNMSSRLHLPMRFWIVGSVLLILAVILGANAHLLYVAVSSAPDCAEETIKANDGGNVQILRPAKAAC